MLDTKTDLDFCRWCVMDHARPVLIHALHIWRLEEPAVALERVNSLNGLKVTTIHINAAIRNQIGFSPLRRNLSHAADTLRAAATFAIRGDSENTAAIVIGVFTNTASALSWRRPWTRFNWKRRHAQVIAEAQTQQRIYREQSTSL